jgi:hypothetical protein
MLRRAKASISQLLDNLAYMYESHGINFEVKEYGCLLMRMLSPFELLSQYGIVGHMGIVGNNDTLPEDNTEWTKKAEKTEKDKRDPNDPQPKKPEKRRNSNNSNEHRTKRVPSPFQVNFDDTNWEPPLEEGTALDDQFRRRSRLGREPVLCAQSEQRLCTWIQQQVACNRSLANGDIVAEARNLTTNAAFIGSFGWLKRFMKRHPDIRNLLRLSRANQFQETQRLQGKISTYDMKKVEGSEESGEDLKGETDEEEGWYQVDCEEELGPTPKVNVLSDRDCNTISNPLFEGWTNFAGN